MDSKRKYQEGDHGGAHRSKQAKVNHPQGVPNLTQIPKLVDSLQDVLRDKESLKLLDNDTINQLSSLQNNLQNLSTNQLKSKQHPPASSVPNPPQSQQLSPNLPKSLSHLSITPWSASAIPKSLPPLPEVYDPTLLAGAFIHHGSTAGRPTDLSYERLEWVGDAYLYVTATLLISQTFPALLPGKCSQMRERIVKNVQLAEYAQEYGFGERAVLPDMEDSKQHEKTKILGDIFEAYIAAIILSDPANGVARCSEWLKQVWSMTLARDIRTNEQKPKLDSPMWRLRGNADPVKLTASKDELVIPPRDRLRNLIGVKGINLTYKDAAPERKDKSNNLPVFTVGVYLDGWGEKDKQLGFGSAHGKKEASAKAAEMAMANTKLMAVYVEKKRLFDAQRAMEEEALAGNN